MVTGGVVLAVMGLVSGEWQTFDPAAISTDSFLAFVYLTIVGSLLAYTTYSWLLGVAPLPLVSTYAYVNPIVAVILGGLILQEPIDARTAHRRRRHRRGRRAHRHARADGCSGRLRSQTVAAVTPPPGSSASPVVRAP